jgi:hypothetical protein
MPKKKTAASKKPAAKIARVPKSSKDQMQLISLSEAVCQSASRAESTYWQAHLEALITKLIDTGSNKVVMAALDYADADAAGDVADTLAEAAETVAQTCFFPILNDDSHNIPYQAALFSIPLIAWSKYQIPAGAIDIDSVDKIHAGLKKHMIANDVQFGLSPYLYAIDGLPQGFAETRTLVKEMADAISNDEQYYPAVAPDSDIIQMPADARFVLGVAIARLGAPIFKWQAITDLPVDNVKREAFADWLTVARDHFVKLLPGCEFEMGMPNAFFHNCRQADIRVRPHSLRAVIHGTSDLLQLPIKNMTVVIAGVGENEIDEYRIGLMRKDDDDVINGAIWPLFASEDAATPPLPIDAIEAIVREAKIGEVIMLDGIHEPEYCEDCGAPFFFNRDGDAIHPFMPDEVDHTMPKYH